MDAYEFTRFDADYTAKEATKDYDLKTIEYLIHYNNPTRDFRSEKEYEEAKDVFYDCTLSCDYDEAIRWMKYFVMNSIAYGNQTRDTKWMIFFLASYDIYKEFVNLLGVI